MSNFKPGMWKR